LIPLKSRDRGKTLQQKPESRNLEKKTLLKLFYSAKPIKSWIDMVVKEEETTHSSQLQTLVDSISNALELLLALQTISHKFSHKGKSSQPISKTKTRYSSLKPLL
jgi:hypothetical protein